MLRSPLLLCLAVIAVAPCIALASTEVPPPRGESIPSSYEGRSSGLPAVGRISLEIMGGAAAGGLSGLVAYYAAEALFDDCYDNPGCIITQILTTAGGIFLATPLGVYAVGRLAGGRGSFWPALLGMAVGSGAGLALVAVFRGNEPFQIASIVTLPVAGAVIGYEISHAHQRPALYWEARADAAGAPRIMPVLGVTPTGRVFGGLSARF